MRPASLNPLFAELNSLKGIGARLEAALSRLLRPANGARARVLDLLWHLPSGVNDRRAQPMIASARPGTLATLRLIVKAHRAPPAKALRAPYKVVAEDASGKIELVFFHADRRYLQRVLPVGEARIVSGHLDAYGDKLQMLHPDYILTEAEAESGVLPLIEPLYPLTEGLSQRMARGAITQALGRLPKLDEWLDASVITARGWPGFSAALNRLHQPQSDEDLAGAALGRERLACDELFANQLAIVLMRRQQRRVAGRQINAAGDLAQTLRAGLPFRLTGSQEAAIADITADLGAPERMLRLVQGDVGSGKTVVALMAMAHCVEPGAQAALMAPTEVLAQQHYETLSRMGASAGLRLGLLSGQETKARRAALLQRLEQGEIDILVGTHALFQPDVVFADLALAVIDEQHRFGVHQRFALQAKGGGGTNILVMTATPIPRTLVMTHFGDLDVSRLLEKPAGRKPVLTRALPVERLHEVVGAVGRACAGGAQVFWVCPLVESSAASPEAAAAEERAAHLRQHFGETVGLVHGRMKAAEKDAVMRAFAEGELRILVATTVIEVGVDVPNATVMVIEHAERFGLAQLHQLRGRVGRGQAQSTCLLLYQGPLSETAEARLKIMRDTEDGFRIAEEDLRLRGGGDILGTRQSGDPGFRIAQLPEDGELLALARDQAKLLAERDPTLNTEQGEAARLCLYLFGQDEAIRLLRAG